MYPRVCGAFAALAIAYLAMSGTSRFANAGTFFTDQPTFDAAVAALTLDWSENFEGLPASSLPAGPLSIGSSGQAEIFTAGPQEIFVQSETGNKAYWNIQDSLDPPTIIRGSSCVKPRLSLEAVGRPDLLVCSICSLLANPTDL